ncbi:MAG: hypothetical protein CVU16_07525 [Betaproteobacteria bacterium HGW-Betaproteobacteria-10]|nr:MAG: hypothetical protein CVU16_07525 [Betaproteobacteria bacterium HGW-Betaproteobacteria-10]
MSAVPVFSQTTNKLQAEAQAAGRAGKLLAVFFTLPDCPGCLEMERNVFTDHGLKKRFSRKFRSVHLDIAQTGTITDPRGQVVSPADFARRLRVVATPSLAFFAANGQTLYRYTGTLDVAGVGKLGDFVTKAAYEERPFSPPPARSPQQALFADPPASHLPQHPTFTLQASAGQDYRLADSRGQAVALSLGYTSCPDVCPTTLAEMKAAVESLPAGQRKTVQLLFASLDPERDSLAILKQYANAFQPAGGRPILGLRGNAQQTARLIGQLQLVAEKRPSASMGYTLDHTAGIFLFDKTGRLVGLSPYGQPLEKLASDLLTLTKD